MITQIDIANLRSALEALWTDVDALSTNPMGAQLGVVDAAERDDYARAMALIDALLAGAQRLKASGGAEHFAMLDHAYGLEGERMRQYQLSSARPTPEELRGAATAKHALSYPQQLEEALAALALTVEASLEQSARSILQD